MTVFRSKDQAQDLFAELFRILLDDPDFRTRLRENHLTVQIIHTKPDFILHLDPDGVRIDDVPEKPVISIKMSCDTAHALWSGTLLMPLAVATGKLRVRGSMAKVLEFAPMLRPAFDQYHQLAAAAGVPG